MQRAIVIPEDNVAELRERPLRNSVPKPNGCREWALKLTHRGYGTTTCGSDIRGGAHRISYAAFKGPIPANMDILHSCDNPPCIEPKHLSVGTDLDNVRDMLAKGRDNYRKRQRLCGAGQHPMKGENVIFRMRKLKSGRLSPSRECRICRCVRLGLTMPEELAPYMYKAHGRIRNE